MNILKTYTVATSEPDQFLLYWTNSPICLRGIIKIRVSANIEDRAIAAELAGLKHLLDQKCVLGQDIVGNAGIHLSVSSGAIRKLLLRKSNKTHLIPYAQFLTTRYAGCQLSVSKDKRWFEGFVPNAAENLLVSRPQFETIHVRGIGEVIVTQHILDRFAERFLYDIPVDKRTSMAWRKLVDLASDSGVLEVSRHSPWSDMKNIESGKREARYFLNPNKKRILVITDNPREGKRLVTTYPASPYFTPLRKAA
jgi:hypothetical protein